MEKFDVIVLGLGAMGSAATYQLAKKGVSVLGIDQFSPPHDRGSSHGDTRIIRQAIGESVDYTRLALRSYEVWREVEKETGLDLLTVTGGLLISSDVARPAQAEPDFLERTLTVAKKFNIGHKILTAGEIRRRFPQFNVQDNETGYYEYEAGFLQPEACVRANLLLAEKYGATLRRNERVLEFSENGGAVRVRTDAGNYQANRLIICAGPWLPELLGKNGADLFTVRRQVMYWFDAGQSIEDFKPARFPVFMWDVQRKKQNIYGFPAIGTNSVKIASAQYETATSPDAVERAVSDDEIREMYREYVAPYFPALSGTCVRAVACMYTMTRDFGFVIDHHPAYSSVIIASPCSGHGFKHSAAIGELLAQFSTGSNIDFDMRHFRINRLTGTDTMKA